MASKDLFNNLKVVQAIAPGTYKGGESPTGAAIDTAGFESVTLALVVGGSTDEQTLTLKHSYDNSSYADVDAADVIAGPGNDAAAILSAFKATGTTDDVVKVLGYKGSRRYLKVESTSSGGDGAAYSVIALLGHPKYRPVEEEAAAEEEE